VKVPALVVTRNVSDAYLSSTLSTYGSKKAGENRPASSPWPGGRR
jgi:hypothetical protein